MRVNLLWRQKQKGKQKRANAVERKEREEGFRGPHDCDCSACLSRSGLLRHHRDPVFVQPATAPARRLPQRTEVPSFSRAATPLCGGLCPRAETRARWPFFTCAP